MAAALARRFLPRSLPTRSFVSSCASFSTEGYKSPEYGNNPDAYKEVMSKKLEILQSHLSSPKRFQFISEREERSSLPPDAMKAIADGKYIGFYRGIDMLKGPEDLSILYHMLWHVRPRTVIELGTFTGASALWMADSLNGADIECNVFSVDLDHSLLHPKIKSLQPHNLSFIEGDCYKIEEVFPSEFLKSQPHPLVVIEDVHENSDNVLDYFHGHLIPGDYILFEDTNPDLPYNVFGSGDWGFEKLHAWTRFLKKQGDMYAIDSFFCDYFGYNASSNWNSYARRMK